MRRGFIAERYGPLIAALYDGSAQCRIDTEVTFEDGRRGTITGDIRIVEARHTAAAKPVKEAAE